MVRGHLGPGFPRGYTVDPRDDAFGLRTGDIVIAVDGVDLDQWPDRVSLPGGAVTAVATTTARRPGSPT